MSEPTREQLSITYAESFGAVYSHEHLTDRVDQGELLELEDFHNAAIDAGTTVSVGTRVMKEVVLELSDDTFPFSDVWRPHAAEKGLNIYYEVGQKVLKLHHFYVKTQELKDHVDSTPDDEMKRLYAEKGRQVVRAVIYD